MSVGGGVSVGGEWGCGGGIMLIFLCRVFVMTHERESVERDARTGDLWGENILVYDGYRAHLI